jgi:hypothetical protein
MWWILGCAFVCDPALERTQGWRAEAALERRWVDYAETQGYGDAFKRGYDTRAQCFAALRAARPEGERPYAHWVGGAPRFRIEVTHHADWLESYNTANNVHLRFACFER